MKQIHPFIGKHYRYAVVGVSNNPEKYGNIVFHDLLHAGFMVVPVNPKYQTIDGERCYPNLQSIHPPVDVAIVVVPPRVGGTIVENARRANVKKLWFQPGAESDEIREQATKHGLRVQANGDCFMVVRRLLGA